MLLFETSIKYPGLNTGNGGISHGQETARRGSDGRAAQSSESKIQLEPNRREFMAGLAGTAVLAAVNGTRRSRRTRTARSTLPGWRFPPATGSPARTRSRRSTTDSPRRTHSTALMVFTRCTRKGGPGATPGSSTSGASRSTSARSRSTGPWIIPARRNSRQPLAYDPCAGQATAFSTGTARTLFR